jgi:hypothetical protein
MSPAIPWFISVIVIATNSAIPVAVWTILARSRARGGPPRESGRRTVNGLALFLGVWLAAGIFIAPKLGLPVSPGGVAIPPAILLAGIGVAVVLAWLSVSSDLRRTVAAAPLPAVIGVQVYRAIGAVFVFLLGLGQLPPHFALPAGWGDVVVGITAPEPVRASRSRRGGRNGERVAGTAACPRSASGTGGRDAAIPAGGDPRVCSPRVDPAPHSRAERAPSPDAASFRHHCPGPVRDMGTSCRSPEARTAAARRLRSVNHRGWDRIPSVSAWNRAD